MNPIVFEATFENGVLKPDSPLPLTERQRLKVTAELTADREITTDPALDFIRETSGMIGWTGDAATVERIGLDPEFGIHESP